MSSSPRWDPPGWRSFPPGFGCCVGAAISRPPPRVNSGEYGLPRQCAHWLAMTGRIPGARRGFTSPVPRHPSSIPRPPSPVPRSPSSVPRPPSPGGSVQKGGPRPPFGLVVLRGSSILYHHTQAQPKRVGCGEETQRNERHLPARAGGGIWSLRRRHPPSLACLLGTFLHGEKSTTPVPRP